MAHKSNILIEVELDDNKVPEKIHWKAEDGGISRAPAKAILMSVWDEKTGDTLKMDLWTKDLLADEMKRLIHQSLLAMADTLERATNDESSAKDMRDFAQDLGVKLELFS